MSHEVFRVHELRQKLVYKIESIATSGSLFFLGTADGKVIVYEVSAKGPQGYDAQSIHIQTTKHRYPIRLIVPIPEKQLLLLLVGDVVVLHKLQAMSRNQLDCLPVDKMPEVGVVHCGADIVTMHVKKQKGLYSLAVLHKKKVVVFELREQRQEFVRVKDGLVIPEGVKTLAWAGKNVLLGFRKEYVSMDVSSGATDILYPTGRSNNPLLACLDPTPELLVGVDSTGLRVMQDGSPVPGNSAMPWGSLPTSVAYYHPYLFTVHEGNHLEVRIPMFRTLLPSPADGGGGAPGVSATRSGSGQPSLASEQQPQQHQHQHEQQMKASSGLCQVISIKHVDRLSARHVVDLDMKIPGTSAPPDLLRKDIIIVVNASNTVFLLEMVPVQEQALALAAARSFEAAVTLCRLCPNEVSEATVCDIVTLYGLNCFKAKRFKEAMLHFRDADTDPRFVVDLFPGFMTQRVRHSWHSPRQVRGLEPIELADCVQDALPAFLDYVSSYEARRAAETVGGAAEDANEEQKLIREALSTAVARSLVVLGREEELLAYLAGTRGNDAGSSVSLHEMETFLADNNQWVALAVLWRARGRVELALRLLTLLGVSGDVPATTAVSAASAAADEVFPRSSPDGGSVTASRLMDLRGRVPLVEKVRTDVEGVLSLWMGRFKPAAQCSDPVVLQDGWPSTRDSGSAALPSQNALEQLLAVQQGRMKDDLVGSGTAPEAGCRGRSRSRSGGGGTVLSAEETKLLFHCVGTVTLLAFLRDLDVNANVVERGLFCQYGEWIFANVSPSLALGTLQPVSVKTNYHELLQLLQRDTRALGPVAADERVAGYLQVVLSGDSSASADADLHNALWLSLGQLIQSWTEAEGIPAEHARLAGYHQQLEAFLRHSEHYHFDKACDWLCQPSRRRHFVSERAIVYQRLKRHTDAIRMYVEEVNSMADAQVYATHVSKDDEDAFKVLLELLLHQPPGGGGGPRTAEALRIIQTCDGVDAATALPMLPGDVPLSELKRFLEKSLRDVHTKRRHVEVYSNILVTRHRRAEQERNRLAATKIVIDATTVCAECKKKLRPDTVFAHFPNGVVVHQACVEDEHVCPVTMRDFRAAVEAAMTDF